jgi:hypothetical protein
MDDIVTSRFINRAKHPLLSHGDYMRLRSLADQLRSVIRQRNDSLTVSPQRQAALNAAGEFSINAEAGMQNAEKGTA